jgi:hypothetical protein
MKIRVFVSFLLACSTLVFQAPSSFAADQIANGSFDSQGGGWIGARYTGTGNAACDGGAPNIGTWEANTLAFSYIKSTVYQDVVISKPSKVTLNYNVKNRTDQVNTLWFSADLGSVSTGNFRPLTTLQSKSLTTTTTVANQVLRIAFTGQDERFWAGCYGTYVTSVSLLVQPTVEEIVPFQSYLQVDLVLTSNPNFIRYGENYICNAGAYGYRSARMIDSPIEKVTLESATFILRSNDKIIGAASSDDFKLLPKWIFGIDESVPIAKVLNSTALWTIPGTASAIVTCEIAGYKENQILYSQLR